MRETVSRRRVVGLAAGWTLSLGIAVYILREDLATAGLIMLGVVVLATGLAIVASGASQRRRRGVSGEAVRVSPALMVLGALYVALGLAATVGGLVKLFADELERQRDAPAQSAPSSARRLDS
jgi:hypothetical protein